MAEISLSVFEIGFLEKENGILVLKPAGVQKTHEHFVSFRSSRGSVLKASVAEDDMRPDHPFRQVVVE